MQINNLKSDFREEGREMKKINYYLPAKGRSV